MKQVILVGLITMISVFAQAAGRQEASAICTSMKFDSDRNQCIQALSKYNYFEIGAIHVCRDMKFDSDKLDCVNAIGDKSYEQYETSNCGKSVFDSDKVKCLSQSGRPATPVPPPPPPRYDSCSSSVLIYELQNIDRSVYAGRNNRARIQINDLINRLQHCP